MSWLANLLINWAVNVFASLTSVLGALIMVCAGGLLWLTSWHCRRRKDGKPGVEPTQLIWAGAIGAILCIAAMLAGLLWQQHAGAIPVRQGQNGPAQKTFTPGIGTPPSANRETIQWNEIFGTTRAVDLMFALFLDGTGPENRSVRLRDAFIESASHGDVIHMQVVGTDNPLDEPFPIEEANPVPPNGFIRLIAHMNPLSSSQGLPNKEFLERWRKIWFNAAYEDGKIDRISFDTSGYFPGLAGPHVTRRTSGK
jgi:hypothetical protein